MNKNKALACHLSPLSGSVVPLGNLLGPMVCALVFKEEDATLSVESKKVFNFQATVTIAFLATILLYMMSTLAMVVVADYIGYAGVAAPVLVALFGAAVIIGNFFYMIRNSIRAHEGRETHYPFSLQLWK